MEKHNGKLLWSENLWSQQPDRKMSLVLASLINQPTEGIAYPSRQLGFRESSGYENQEKISKVWKWKLHLKPFQRLRKTAQDFHQRYQKGQCLAGSCSSINSHILVTTQQWNGGRLHRRGRGEAEWVKHAQGFLGQRRRERPKGNGTLHQSLSASILLHRSSCVAVLVVYA